VAARPRRGRRDRATPLDACWARRICAGWGALLVVDEQDAAGGRGDRRAGPPRAGGSRARTLRGAKPAAHRRIQSDTPPNRPSAEDPHAFTRRPHHRRGTRRPARAVAAADAGVSVAILSKVHPGALALGRGRGRHQRRDHVADDWRSHAYDTVKGSDFLGRPGRDRGHVREAPKEVMHLEHIGVTFHRNEAGELDLRAFGGASAARTYYVADITARRSCTCSTSSS
jgi:hypothetical protein